VLDPETIPWFFLWNEEVYELVFIWFWLINLQSFFKDNLWRYWPVKTHFTLMERVYNIGRNLFKQWLSEITTQAISWNSFKWWLSEITTQTIGWNSFKWWLSEITKQMISWILFKRWLSEITVWTIGQNSLKMKKKNTESRRDEDVNIQSKNGPLRVHRMNSKFQNRKLTRRRTMSDEERTKNGEERSRIWLWKRYRSASALIFYLFLLLFTNFKWNMLS